MYIYSLCDVWVFSIFNMGTDLINSESFFCDGLGYLYAFSHQSPPFLKPPKTQIQSQVKLLFNALC